MLPAICPASPEGKFPRPEGGGTKNQGRTHTRRMAEMLPAICPASPEGKFPRPEGGGTKNQGRTHTRRMAEMLPAICLATSGLFMVYRWMPSTPPAIRSEI